MKRQAQSNLLFADEKTFFVLGNGPSLRDVDLTALSPFATVGMNAAYRYWREIDWRPTFYACLDLVVGLSHGDEIEKLIREGRIKKFLLRENLIEALGAVGEEKSVVNFDALRFDVEVMQPPAVTTGSHSALWGASMGFDQIVLLGVDAQYQEIVPGAREREGIELEIVERSANPNYFFDDYQRPGDKYNLPNPQRGLHVDAWRAAAAALKQAGVCVVNGNAASAVRVFPYVNLDKLLKGGDFPAPAGEKVSAELLSGSPMSRMARFQQFSRKHAALLAGAIAAGAGALVALSALGADLKLGLFVFSLFYLLFVFVLYTRAAVTDHLRALEEKHDRLHAAWKEMTRVRTASDRGRK